MVQAERDWIDIITEMLWIVERETKLSLRDINDDFKQSGLSFDIDFRTHFLQIIMKRVAKTYDQFQMHLELEELENRLDSEDSSLYEQQQFVDRPYLTHKRKLSNESYVNNQTFLVKRPRIDEEAVMEGEFENQLDAESISNESINVGATSSQTDKEDGGDIAVELDKDVLELDNDIIESDDVNKLGIDNDDNCVSQIVTADTCVKGDFAQVTPTESPEKLKTRRVTRSILAKKQQQTHKIDQTSDPLLEKNSRPNCSLNSAIEKSTRNSDDPVFVSNALVDNSKMPKTRRSRNIARGSILNEVIANEYFDIDKESHNLGPAPASVKKARLRAIIRTKSTSTKSTKINKFEASERAKPRRSNLIGVKHYKCEQCEFRTKYPQNLAKHILHHQENPFWCDVCKRKFPEQDLLVMHKKIHENVCPTCKRRFKGPQQMQMHKNICKGAQFECYLCDFRHGQKYCLERHMRIHTGEKPYECKICHRRFARRDAVQSHMKLLHKCA